MPRDRRPGFIRQMSTQMRGCIIAGNAEHAHTVAAIGRGIDLEHHIVEIERRAQVRAQPQRRREFQDPIVLRPQTQFTCRAQHAVGFEAAQLRPPDDDPARQLRTHPRYRHLQAGAHVRCAADDLQPVRAIGGHLAQRELFSTASTSSPASVSRCASSAGDTSSGMNSRSH